MANTTTAPKPGDTKKGFVFTEQGTWAPPSRPRRSTPSGTFLLIFVSPHRTGHRWLRGPRRRRSQRGQQVHRGRRQQGRGHRQPADDQQGKAFEVDGFKYAAGWSIGKDALGDLDVKGLKVTNNRDDKDSALVEIKLWKGTEVVALTDCTTEPIGVGTTVSLSCLSADRLPKGYDKITINDTF